MLTVSISEFPHLGILQRVFLRVAPQKVFRSEIVIPEATVKVCDLK